MAVVTGQRSGQNQLEDLLRRVISTMEPPAPKPEVPDVEKLLQQLVRGTQSWSPAVVSAPVPTALEQMLRSFFDGQRNNSGRLRDSDLPDETGPMWCVSPVGSQVIRRRVARPWMRHFRSCSQDGGQKRRHWADLR